MKVSEEVAPNLVPMIDIMFLLLLFFMLSADMGQRELEEVLLPLAMSVKEDKENENTKEEEEQRLTVNIYHKYSTEVKCDAFNARDKGAVCRDEKHWLTGIKGTDYTDVAVLEKRLTAEAKASKGKDPKNPHVSERKVMIRCDSVAPYGLAQKAMNVCAKVGIYKIDVGAALHADADKKKPAAAH